jgi:RND family efflux transporter MFP subunit
MSANISRLDDLKIDRNAAQGNDSPKWIWPLSLVTTAALLTVGVWLFVGAEGESANAAMQIDAAPVQNSVAPPPASMLDASGYVVARRQATVSSKIQGRLLEVLIEEGDHVEAGQILAKLDNSNAMAVLVQAQARVAQGEAALRSAETALADFEATNERDKGLLAREIISAQQAEATEAEYNTRRMAVLVAERAVDVQRATLGVAHQNLDDTIVRAPFAGIVIAKAAEPGEIVSPNSTGGFTRTGIGTIVDMDSLEVEVDVSESFISRVRPNLPATVRLNAYPDWDIPAQVLAVIPTADRARATVRVRVALLEKDSRIIPEMGARVSFRENNLDRLAREASGHESE